MRKIVTNYEFPPIPDRRFDWCAYYDGDEESGRIGRGATEAEAIRDFVANYLDDSDASLIAAAPDLLEAANAQDDLMRAPGDPTENIQRVIRMRRAAIAKAEGRAGSTADAYANAAMPLVRQDLIDNRTWSDGKE